MGPKDPLPAPRARTVAVAENHGRSAVRDAAAEPRAHRRPVRRRPRRTSSSASPARSSTSSIADAASRSPPATSPCSASTPATPPSPPSRSSAPSSGRSPAMSPPSSSTPATTPSPSPSPPPPTTRFLATYTRFSAHSVVRSEGLADRVRGEVEAAAYWTAVAPNIEEYGGNVAKTIATGADNLAKGILWCGEMTVERLRWGNEVLRKRIQPGDAEAEVSPEMLKRIKMVKKVTKMTEEVAAGILSGVVKVTGYFTGSLANSKAGIKFFSLLPGKIVLASLDGFGKICDAIEEAGKDVLSTSSTVTTGLVSHRYGEKVAAATNEGLDVAGHALGTAWAVFKISQAMNPKRLLKPTSLAKSTIRTLLSKL